MSNIYRFCSEFQQWKPILGHLRDVPFAEVVKVACVTNFSCAYMSAILTNRKSQNLHLFSLPKFKLKVIIYRLV